jgi:2-oxoglutarate ferredoxin oxidoreductase subunit alpha
MDKRAAKLITCAREDMEPPRLYGPKKAKLTIVSWGSTSGPILEAIKNIPDVNYLHITWMNPFPIEFVTDTLKHASQILAIECSKTGDLTAIIREKTGINVTNMLLKYDGRPFYPDEIIAKIKNSYKKFSFFSLKSYRK